MIGERKLRTIKMLCKYDIYFMLFADYQEQCYMAFQRFVNVILKKILVVIDINQSTTYIDGTKIEVYKIRVLNIPIKLI